MKILTDKEGAEFIRELCSLALKAGGIQNLESVSKMINSIETIC